MRSATRMNRIGDFLETWSALLFSHIGTVTRRNFHSAKNDQASRRSEFKSKIVLIPLKWPVFRMIGRRGISNTTGR